MKENNKVIATIIRDVLKLGQAEELLVTKENINISGWELKFPMTTMMPYEKDVNMDTFIRLAKRWAYTKGFTLSSGPDGFQYKCHELHNDRTFRDHSEPEAVFKALIWIQESIEKYREKGKQ